MGPDHKVRIDFNPFQSPKQGRASGASAPIPNPYNQPSPLTLPKGPQPLPGLDPLAPLGQGMMPGMQALRSTPKGGGKQGMQQGGMK